MPFTITIPADSLGQNFMAKTLVEYTLATNNGNLAKQAVVKNGLTKHKPLF